MAHNDTHKSGIKGPDINEIGIVMIRKEKNLSVKDNCL